MTYRHQIMRLLLLIFIFLTYLDSFANTTTVSSDLRVWFIVSDNVVADGETVNYITVYQHDDSETVYTAFNMEFILPEGFTVNKVKKGREMVDDIFLSCRATSTHGIYCNLVDNIDLRIISDSGLNENFYPDDEDGNPTDELFTVGLIISPTVAAGEYDIQCKGIKFVIDNGDACIPATEPITKKITIINPSAGIKTIPVDESSDDRYYDIMGRPVNPDRIEKGFIISNGKKIFIDKSIWH